MKEIQDSCPLADTSHRVGRFRPISWWFNIALWKRILGALLFGALAGHFLGESVIGISWLGDLFIRSIRMVVVPLVFLMVASGVASLADPKRLGRIGLKTVSLYATTTTLAVITGMLVVIIVAPGFGSSLAGATPQAIPTPQNVSRVFLEIVPDNPISAMAEGKTLSIILFAVMIGAGVIAAGKSAEPVRALLAAGSQVMLRIVGFVMELAPFGVFALIAVVTATGGLAAYFNILKLALCVLIGSTFIVVVIHGVVLIRLLGWLSPLSFFRGISDAILVGFSTSSSSATLPVAIRVAEKNIGVSPSIASTVLPIGATIGMDGAAMYVAILAVFATQAFGIDVSFNDYLIIAITTAVVAMGVAPVPSGSLFVLATVLQVVGVSPAQAAIVIGFILPFDRILDMIRTIPNVTSDLAIATLIARWEGELDIERYRSSGG